MFNVNPVRSSLLVLVATFASQGAFAAIPGPVPVEVVNAPSRVPFAITRSCVTAGQKSCNIANISVPADKTLVIEHVSLSGSNSNNLPALAQLSFFPDGEQAYLYIPAVLMPNGQSFISEQVRVYADAGTSVALAGVFLEATSGGFAMTISGYFVDCNTEYVCGVK